MGSGGQRFSSAVFALIGVFLLLVVLDYALGSVGTRRISVASMNYSIGRSTTTYFITTTDGHQYQVAWSVYRVAQPGELLNCKVTTYPALLLSRVDACTATGG